MHLSAERMEEMPEYLRGNDKYCPLGWFEEDCEVALVVLAFPQFFKPHHRDDADRTVESMYPEIYRKYIKGLARL